MKRWTAEELLEVHDVVLFMLAYPEHEALERKAKKVLKAITGRIKSDKTLAEKLEGSGLPFTKMYVRFTHDLLTWMQQQGDFKIVLDSYEEKALALNTVLKFTLSNLERDMTTMEGDNNEVLQELKVSHQQRVGFLMSQFAKLNAHPYIKDYL